MTFLDHHTVSIGPFDVIEAHKNLEVCEARIQRGEDAEHQHPCLAPVASSSSKELVLSEDETAMGSRYECQLVAQRVPLFWPERVWDEEACRMSQEETDRLTTQIVESDGFDPDSVNSQAASPPVEPKMRRPGSGRPKRARDSDSAILRIDLRSVETDSEDTDFGDF
jgi:hypothetical protein